MVRPPKEPKNKTYITLYLVARQGTHSENQEGRNAYALSQMLQFVCNDNIVEIPEKSHLGEECV